MPRVRFRLNGAETEVDADPDRSLLDILRGQLGMTGPHFGCGASECGACNVMIGDHAVLGLRHAAVVGRGQGHHHAGRTGQRRTAASAAARVHRRAGAAMRLLRLRHPDQRGGAVEAKSVADRPRGQGSARPQSLPLRLAQPHGAGGAARGERDGRGMNQAASPPPPKLPVSLAANPKLSSWLKFSSTGQVTVSPGKVEIGQGIVTALAQIAADELDVDLSRVQMVRASTAASPNEGVTSGSLSVQQSGRALRHACAEVRQIFLQRPRSGWALISTRSTSRTAPSRDPAMSGPAIGNWPTKSRSIATRRRASAPKSAAQRALAGNSVQRIDIPDKVFAQPRFIHDQCAAGNAARPRAAARQRARETDRT